MRRTLHDLGNPLTGRPRELIVIYSQHCCTRCRKYFNADMTDLAAPGSHSTKPVVDTAVRLVIEDGLPYRAASWSLWHNHRVFVPYATIQNWVEDGGEKAQRRIPTDYLDWALSDFSGYIAADELYDGPFCVLSIVDNRTFKRLSYHVLDRDPTQVDIEAFLRRFRQALEARGLTVQGITTDGSTLYPEPIAAVFGAVPHQVCQFHILHEVNKAILSAVAQERKRLAAGAPKLPRGRPSSKAAKRAARRKKRIKQKVGELFAHRYLFVQRRLSPSERATLQRISRGWPQLHSLRGLIGGGLPVVRSAVPDGHSVGQAGEAAGAVAAVRPAAEGAQEAARRRGWRRPWCSWTSGCSAQRPTRWNVAIVATARCRRRCTGFGRSGRSRAGWRWTCCGSSTPKAGLRPPRFCTRRGRHDAIARYPCYSLNLYRITLEKTN